MNAELIFSISNLAAIVGWLLLVFAARWSWTRRIVAGITIPLLSALYLILISVFFGGSEGGFGSLADVSKLFSNEWLLLAGWVHYLAFDLFIGSWVVSDSRARGISHWLVIPCLPLTFMFGPIGLLAYSIVRIFAGKEVSNDSPNS